VHDVVTGGHEVKVKNSNKQWPASELVLFADLLTEWGGLPAPHWSDGRGDLLTVKDQKIR